MKKNKLHVLQVVGTMNRGGAETMLMDIYRNISEDIHFDFLVNYKIKQGILKGAFDTEIRTKNSQIKYIGSQWDIGPIKYIQVFKNICKELGTPDVVHIHLNAKSGIIAMAAKMTGVKKIIVHSHADLKFRGSLLHNIFSKVELFVQQILIKKYATDYWGASYEACKSLYPNNNNVVIINNAVDVKSFQNVEKEKVKRFKKENHINDTTFILGNIGRVVKHKNVDFIIDILNELNLRKKDFIFIFAGREDDKAYMQEINNKISRYNLSEKVLYLSERDDIPLIVSALDVFVAPALQEGFGLVAVEAQAAGIPCVLYTGFPSLVDMDLKLVSFIDNLNSKIWADRIESVKDMKLSDHAMILDSIENKGFDIKKNTEIIEKLYRGTSI